MKVFIILIVAIAIITTTAFLKRKSMSNNNAATLENKRLTLEQKLSILSECGIKLKNEFTIKNLLTSWDRSEYEENGFDLVLVGLGMTEEQEPWRNHSDNLWHFDTECIEDHGSYKDIIKRMAELTKGSLHLTNINDFVDIEKNTAWFSFTHNGKEYKYNCKVDNDWVDTDIFIHFIELLKTSDPSKIYIYYDLGGQDCIIGCVSVEELKKLQTNGINFVPLS